MKGSGSPRGGAGGDDDCRATNVVDVAAHAGGRGGREGRTPAPVTAAPPATAAPKRRRTVARTAIVRGRRPRGPAEAIGRWREAGWRESEQ